MFEVCAAHVQGVSHHPTHDGPPRYGSLEQADPNASHVKRYSGSFRGVIGSQTFLSTTASNGTRIRYFVSPTPTDREQNIGNVTDRKTVPRSRIPWPPQSPPTHPAHRRRHPSESIAGQTSQPASIKRSSWSATPSAIPAALGQSGGTRHR